MLRKIAVCDDEKTMLRQLSNYLDQIKTEVGDDFDMFFYNSAEELLAHMPRDVRVVLLDISMENMTGMECARQLRAEGFDGDLFFITNMPEFAIEGYEVHAFAFIEKPVTYVELERTLTDCFARSDNRHSAVFPMETAGGIELLPIENIIYAEVYQHETSFVLSSRKASGAVQLSEIERKLFTQGFFRCHRSYLVNMKHIKRIDTDTLTMSDGAIIPLSKYRRKDFLNTYTKYMGVHLS